MSEQKEIIEYFEKKKEIQEVFLRFLESSLGFDDDFSILTLLIKEQKIQQKPKELKHFLQLIKIVSNNHHRETPFLSRIKKILTHFKKDIIGNLSTSTLFKIFFSNKAILLFLIKEKFIILKKSYLNFLLDSGEDTTVRYCHFFLPEIKKLITKDKYFQIEQEIKKFNTTNIEKYEEKRLQGENDFELCSIIRADLLDEFTNYIIKFNIPHSAKIKPSIFETNSFLINKNPSLIEYAAFYGSIKIFKHLIVNNVSMNQELFLYAIHSQNAELIRLLENNNNNKIFPDIEAYEESIKCHHNDIAKYIYNYLLYQKKEEESILKEKTIEFSIKYYNYSFLPDEFDEIDNNNGLHYLLHYDYSTIINFFMKIKKNELESKTDENLQENNTEPFNKTEMYKIYYSLTKQNTIPIKSFFNCKKLIEITVPYSIKSIDNQAFCDCSYLSIITIPSTVTSIRPSAFRECKLLKQVILPLSVKSIGKFAFTGCLSLSQINIPSSVKSIGECAFLGCTNLKQISIPSSISKLIKKFFQNARNWKKYSFHHQ